MALRLSLQRLIRAKLLLLAIVVTIVSVGFRPAAAQQQSVAFDTNRLYLVQFAPETTEAERIAIVTAMNAEIINWIAAANTAQVRLAPAADVAASQALAPYAHLLRYVEPDIVVTGQLATNDPALNDPDKGYGPTLIQAPRAWDLTAGEESTIVAILDTGLNPQHPEFAGRVVAGYDYINADDDPMDDHGHGTHVAGIAVAAMNNGQGSAGVCPRCRIMSVKVLDTGNRGTWGTVASGIYYAVDHGARVINLSLGASATSITLENAVDYAERHGVLIVAAAGNAASDRPYYPAAIPYVVAVGATDSSDALWPLSNTGDHIDVTAPGSRIYSTYHDLEQNSGYVYMTGTSMASPFVAGLAGLLFSQDRDRTAGEVNALIAENADDLGDRGKDALFGYGRVNAYRALVAGNGGIEPNPTPTPADPGDETPVTPTPELTPVPHQPESPLPPASKEPLEFNALYLPVITRS